MTRTFYPGSRAFLAGIVALAAATTFAGGARATVIYDATGGRAPFEGADVADPNAPGGVGVGPLLADRFLSPFAERLTSVTLNLKLDGRPLDGFTVDLWRDSTTTPGLPIGPEIQIALVSDLSLTSNLKLYTFTPLATSCWPRTPSTISALTLGRLPIKSPTRPSATPLTPWSWRGPPSLPALFISTPLAGSIRTPTVPTT